MYHSGGDVDGGTAVYGSGEWGRDNTGTLCIDAFRSALL